MTEKAIEQILRLAEAAEVVVFIHVPGSDTFAFWNPYPDTLAAEGRIRDEGRMPISKDPVAPCIDIVIGRIKSDD